MLLMHFPPLHGYPYQYFIEGTHPVEYGNILHLGNERIHQIYPIELTGPEFLFVHFSGNSSADPCRYFVELMMPPLHGIR